ncbi:class Ib ribonucleoside-diphosphate reductase assembly flavoprotein NrdI [Lactococcus garvieae]|jgi:protein involved in ribonucleotide reduction|uniref:Ribonucleotide reduction protein NrdI n=1 Tax=Lactococcus garvieae DCC43 TaxID=1231377 RepID=K2PWW0_9LACT|nr:class Ib ribonucleoside-diphosphate reductase assembly flavoprotein NrdI [Lactococcus garvieae]EKF51926.1 Ribonucleotide reduction protein NrdI [Lactococcus garvieae DCC43]
MQTINIVYISLSGNTEYFINQLANHIEKIYGKYTQKINVKNLHKEGRDFPEMQDSYVAFLPSYLEGGNGIDNGYKEILTTPLKDFLSSNDNYKKCLGIIGSGNKNFNKQFCLTALQYSDEFGFPLLDTFELRGTEEDVERIAKNIIEKVNL